MADRRLHDLVKRLHSKTEEGRLNWETTVDEQAYRVIFPRHSIKIAYDGKRDLYRISLINEDGITAESFTDRDLGDWQDINYSEMMEDIYIKARRRALKTDQTLDEVLAELEDV